MLVFLPPRTPVSGASSEEPSATSSTSISDEDISQFLFHIPENIQEKVKKLSPEKTENIPVPVFFSQPEEVRNSWHNTRSEGRLHEGTDIIAGRGNFVISPTEAVVTNIGFGHLSGNYVITANPGGEQFFYAHLDSVAPGLKTGDFLERGDLIGYVGNTGNAVYSPSHLHLGIYYQGTALNPFPRLKEKISLEEEASTLEKILASSGAKMYDILLAVENYQDFIGAAESAGVSLPTAIDWALKDYDVVVKAKSLMRAGLKSALKNEDVRLLQEILINAESGPAASALAKVGPTGHFGPLSENALAEFQKNQNITSSGKLDSGTIARLLNFLGDSAKNNLAKNDTFFAAVENLGIGNRGEAVKTLQDFLIKENSGPAALALGRANQSGYFGELTKNALAEYQAANGISPATGFFGPLTRAKIQSVMAESPTQNPELLGINSR